jgi:hypothetical protein
MPDELAAASGQVRIGAGVDSSETPFPAYYRTGRSTLSRWTLTLPTP